MKNITKIEPIPKCVEEWILRSFEQKLLGICPRKRQKDCSYKDVYIQPERLNPETSKDEAIV